MEHDEQESPRDPSKCSHFEVHSSGDGRRPHIPDLASRTVLLWNFWNIALRRAHIKLPWWMVNARLRAKFSTIVSKIGPSTMMANITSNKSSLPKFWNFDSFCVARSCVKFSRVVDYESWSQHGQYFSISDIVWELVKCAMRQVTKSSSREGQQYHLVSRLNTNIVVPRFQVYFCIPKMGGLFSKASTGWRADSQGLHWCDGKGSWCVCFIVCNYCWVVEVRRKGGVMRLSVDTKNTEKQITSLCGFCRS